MTIGKNCARVNGKDPMSLKSKMVIIVIIIILISKCSKHFMYISDIIIYEHGVVKESVAGKSDRNEWP